jgi:hypothetical protein
LGFEEHSRQYPQDKDNELFHVINIFAITKYPASKAPIAKLQKAFFSETFPGHYLNKPTNSLHANLSGRVLNKP